MRVLLTQSAQDTEASAAALQARGHEVLVVPLVSAERAPPPKINLAGAQAFLVTSAEGARALAEHVGVRTFPVFADGAVTAAALRTLGFKHIETAKDDAADLARLVERSLTPANGALIYACSTAAPVNLPAMLSNMGFAVRPLPFYTLKRVEQMPTALREALENRAIDTALFLSPDEARAFVALVQRAELEPLVKTLATVAVTPIVAAPLRALKLGGVSEPKTADLDAAFDMLREKLIDRVEEQRIERERKTKEDADAARAVQERAEHERRAREQAEQERLEKERIALEQAAKEREARAQEERERLVRDRAAKERVAQERAALEKAERERRAAEKAEQDRIAREKAASEQAERERVAQERAAQERLERERRAVARAEEERIAAERAAQQKAEREHLAREQAEKDRIERERLAVEKAEQDRIAREKAAAQKAERDRLAQEQAERDRIEAARLAAERAERDRVAAEQMALAKTEQERLALERAEQARQERERLAAEKAEQDRIAREKAAAEKAERERLAEEKAEQDRIERERRAAEKAEQGRAAREKTAQEKAERQRIAEEQAVQAAAEKTERQRLAEEQAARERVERERLAAERAERERLAREAATAAMVEKQREKEKRALLAKLEKDRIAAEKAAQKAEQQQRVAEEKQRIAAERAQRPPRESLSKRFSGWFAKRAPENAPMEATGPWDMPGMRDAPQTVAPAASSVTMAPSVAAPSPRPETIIEPTTPEPKTAAPVSQAVSSGPQTKEEAHVSENLPHRGSGVSPDARDAETGDDPKPTSRGGGRAARLQAEDAADLRAKDQRFKYLGHSDAPPPEADAAYTASPDRGGPGRAIALFLVLALIVVGVFATASWWIPRITHLVQTPTASNETAIPTPSDLAALQARVTALEQSASQNVSADALNTAEQELMQRLAALEARTGNGENHSGESGGGEAVTSLGESLSSQAKQLTAVSARLATLEAAIGNSARLEDLSKRLNMLEGRSAEAHSVLALSDRVTALETTARRTMVEQSSNIALLMAVGQWRDALMAGKPFALELQTTKALATRAGDMSVDDSAFAEAATRGLPTLGDLQRQFGPAAAAAMRASAMPDGASAWYRRIFDRILSIITVRRLDGDAAGTSTAAVLARAQQHLTEGDLPGAVAEMNGLTGAAATAAQTWTMPAKMRVAAEQAAADVSIKAVAAVAATGLSADKTAPAAAPSNGQ